MSRLSQEDIDKLLQEDTSAATFTDVFIAGSGPIACVARSLLSMETTMNLSICSCTYARRVLEGHPNAKVYMAEIGSQDHPIIGAHHKNSIKSVLFTLLLNDPLAEHTLKVPEGHGFVW
jgi:hypothetical protein